MTILAIDQGTTLTKAFVLRSDGTFPSVGCIPHQQLHPAIGLVEHDAEELASNVEVLIERALTQEPDIEGVALANQGETVIAWDRRSKKPLSRAIVWQDQRTQAALDAVSAEARAYIAARTGLPTDAYFSASKLAWLLKNVPGAADAARAGYLGLATSDAFFIDRLTGTYASDVTTASRTSLMDLRSCVWDTELCRIFEVPIGLLPSIRPSTSRFGVITRSGREIPLVTSIVDQQAALFGHGCRALGDAKVTFGTGSFALAITGPAPIMDRKGMIPTVAWAHPDEAPVYALDGGDYTASSAINWTISVGVAKNLADFNLSEGPTALERGLVFVPALAGLAAPHWDRGAPGLWIGLRQHTTAEDMRRAVMEGIALRAVELVEGLCGPNQGVISVDGGVTRNKMFVQFFADLFGRPVQLSANPDLTALGAAELGFIALGRKPPSRAAGQDRLILPKAASTVIQKFRSTFSEAVGASRAFGRATACAGDAANRSDSLE